MENKKQKRKRQLNQAESLNQLVEDKIDKMIEEAVRKEQDYISPNEDAELLALSRWLDYQCH